MIVSPPPHRRAAAFTLLEILLASMGAALVLAALYGIFIHAVRLRDTATEHVRDARVRARAESVIRTDLRNAIISGGVIAAALEGGTNNNSGPGGASLPGYLKFTTTTGRDNGTDLQGDVQQVEYYLTHDPDAPAAADQKGANVLIRAITRDLLATPAPAASEEQILHGVQSLAVEFYDGANWQQTWSYDSAAAALTNSGDSSGGTVIAFGNTTLPDAVRVEVQQAAATPNGHLPPPVEVLVPWTTQPFAAATPTTSTNTLAVTPSPSPSSSPSSSPGASASPPPGDRPNPPNGPPGGKGPPPGNGPPPDQPPPSGSRPPRR